MGQVQGRLDTHALDHVHRLAHDVFHGQPTHQAGELGDRIRHARAFPHFRQLTPGHVPHIKSVKNFALRRLQGQGGNFHCHGRTGEAQQVGGKVSHRRLLAQIGVQHAPVNAAAHKPLLQRLAVQLRTGGRADDSHELGIDRLDRAAAVGQHKSVRRALHGLGQQSRKPLSALLVGRLLW